MSLSYFFFFNDTATTEIYTLSLHVALPIYLLLLVGALEVEGAAIGAGVDLALSEIEDLVAAGDFLVEGLVGIEGVAALVDVAELDALADPDRTFVRLLLAGDHAEQGRLAGTVRADDADDAARRQLEREAVDEELVAEGFFEIVELDDVVAQALGDRDDDLSGRRALLVGLGHEVLVALDTGLRLGLTSLRRGRHPLALALDGALVGRVLTAFLLEALLLLLEPGRVIALVGNAAATVELENPAGHVVEEVAVVSDDQDRARIVAQMAFEPTGCLGVQVVGGLVEEQQLRLLQEQLAESHAAALAARELVHGPIVRRAAQRVHGLIDL